MAEDNTQRPKQKPDQSDSPLLSSTSSSNSQLKAGYKTWRYALLIIYMVIIIGAGLTLTAWIVIFTTGNIPSASKAERLNTGSIELKSTPPYFPARGVQVVEQGVIDTPEYTLKGAVITDDVARLTITSRGQEIEITEFTSPLNNWVYLITEDSGLIAPGNNELVIRAYHADGSIIVSQRAANYAGETFTEVVVQLEYMKAPGTITDRMDLTINYLPDIQQLDAVELLKEQESALNYNTTQSGRKEWKSLLDNLEIYRVGTVASGPYQGDDLLIFHQEILFHGQVLIDRVIHDLDQNRFILLRQLSGTSDTSETYLTTLFWAADDINIPSLFLPERLSLNGATLIAGRFSPDDIFNHFRRYYQYNADTKEDESFLKNWEQIGEIKGIGTIYEELDGGYFIVRNPDHTIKIYEAELPTRNKLLLGNYGRYYYPDEMELKIDLDDGGLFTGIYGFYASTSACQPSNYSVLKLSPEQAETRFESMGTFAGYQFLAPIDLADELYDLMPKADEARQLVKEKYPVLMVQDGLGRYVAYFNIEFLEEYGSGCSYSNSVLSLPN